MRASLYLLAWFLCSAAFSHVAFGDESPPDAISFNQDIRPILSDNCFFCHGPDENERQADVRLDVPEQVDLDEFLSRITETDPDLVMPPPETNKRLSAEQVELLRRWIDDGAAYQTHWSFAPTETPGVPAVENDRFGDHAIDRFVFAKLRNKGLSPNKPADKRTLIRRVTMDLTGLPPTREEVRAFVDDDSDDAYEKLVDRLLDSPHYGEHMARYWLDLVRFADTNGLHHDHYREMTPYRDWVIRAFNQNLPFDQFAVAQIAGDLYEQPTTDQLIASGFNRLHLIIDRGTALPEESFTRNVVDRVSAVGTAFLGLTLECAVCHDHKYDPITQRDFYQLYAFFNNFDGGPETGGRNGLDFKRGLQPPYLELPTDEQKAGLKKLNEKLASIQSRIDQIKAATKSGNQTTGNKATDEKPSDKQNDQDVTKERAAELAELTASLKQTQAQRDKLIESIPATLIMKERAEIRPAHILIRGNYDQPGEQVERDTPAFLPPMKKADGQKTRMDFARWLVDANNPLPARVAVNRFWQQLFGVGMVKTSEDFGAQGEPPSHPELLDHLTVRFVESGWNVKALLRSVVLSETYRQSSIAPRQQYVSDPENRLLSRGSRYRYDAEVIRDQVLAVSGLLNPNLFGRSVKPPQPEGLWKIVAMPFSYPRVFVADEGDKIYRRSVYSFWKRGLPPPQMTIFDAPSRESCTARRERTNTPLQALVLMNEQQYFAAAMHLANSLLSQTELSDQSRIEIAYESITSHLPDDTTRKSLLSALEQFRQEYRDDPESAKKMIRENLAEADDHSAADRSSASTDSAELAAMTMLVHSMLNLDVTKTRE